MKENEGVPILPHFLYSIKLTAIGITIASINIVIIPIIIAIAILPAFDIYSPSFFLII